MWAVGLCVAMATIASLGEATPTNFTDCGSKTGKIRSFDVSPCPTQPCQFHINTNVDMKLDFVSSGESQTVTAVVFGIISGMPVPLPIPDPDACNEGVRCPVKKGNENTFSMEIYVDPAFPMIDLQAKIELKDDHSDDITCLTFPIKIIN